MVGFMMCQDFQLCESSVSVSPVEHTLSWAHHDPPTHQCGPGSSTAPEPGGIV